MALPFTSSQPSTTATRRSRSELHNITTTGYSRHEQHAHPYPHRLPQTVIRMRNMDPMYDDVNSDGPNAADSTASRHRTRSSQAGPSTTTTNTTEDMLSNLPDDFTYRALLVGLLIGCLLAFTNLYLGLQSGWISMMSLQSSLLGFLIFKFLPRTLKLSGRTFHILQTPLTVQENVLIQTTAAAVGVMPLSAGLVGVIPALKKLSFEKDGSLPIDLSFVQLLGWCTALAYFGVFFASPLRKPMIVKEKLTFPSGTATAQLIAVLHDKPLIAGRSSTTTAANPLNIDNASTAENGNIHSNDGRRRRSRYSDDIQDTDQGERARLLSDSARDGVPDPEAMDQNNEAAFRSLLYSFSGSAAFTLLSYYIPVLYAMPIFDILPPHNLASMWGFWFTPSLNYIGQGIIMGLPTTVSMTAGALVGWAILSPLSYYKGWAPGPPLDSENGGKGWILWISLAIMCSESIIGLLALVGTNGWKDLRAYYEDHQRRTSNRKPRSGGAEGASRGQYQSVRRQDSDTNGNGTVEDGDNLEEDEDDTDHEPSHRQTPTSWVIWGLCISTLLGVILIYWTFGVEGISPWATFLGILLASLFAILGVRALGETDLNPVSGIGKISQLIFALLQPGNVVANLIAGGISEAGAMQAGDLMQDYKTGHLVGASPRSQFKGQLIGSTLGILISCFAYKLYTNTYEIPGPQFPAPTANVWLNLARLVNHGHLPDQVGKFMIVFAAIFGVTGTIKTLARTKALQQEQEGGQDQGQQSPRSNSMAQKLAKYVPSGIAFAVGMLNTPNFSLARLVGGVIASVYYRKLKQTGGGGNGRTKPSSSAALQGIGIIIIASGFVLGEGAASIVTLLLKQNGANAWTCAGCRGGCAGGCA